VLRPGPSLGDEFLSARPSKRTNRSPLDVPMGEAMRWVEVALPGAATTIALAPPPEGQQAGGGQTGICLDTSDVDADHAALKAAGVDVDDEVARWGGPVPPMFWLRDPDGNALIIVQPSR